MAGPERDNVAVPMGWAVRGSFVLVYASVLGFALGALVLIAIASVDPEVIFRVAESRSPDGRIESVDLDVVRRTQARALGLGIIYAAVAVSLILLRSRLRRGAAAGLVSIGGETRTAWSRLRLFAIGERSELVGVAALTALAAVLAAVYMGQPMRLDETTTFLTFGTRPVLYVVGTYTSTNNHVLHSALMRVSVVFFGEGQSAIRLPALLAGVAMVPLAYAVARRYADRSIALLAAALLASSTVLVDLATNARGYPLMTDFFLAMLLVAPAAVTINRAAWVLLVVLAALGAWVVPVMIFPFTIVSAVIVLERLRTHGLQGVRTFFMCCAAAVVATGVLVSLLYSPVILTAGVRPSSVSPLLEENTASSTTVLAQRLLVKLGEFWSMVTLGWPRWMAIASLGLICIGGVGSMRKWPRMFTLFGATLVLPLVVSAVTRVSIPSWSWSFLVPLYFLFTSAGAIVLIRVLTRASLRRTLAVAAVILNVTLLLASDYPQDNPGYVGFHDAPQASEFIASGSHSEARFIGHIVDLRPISYELYRRGVASECPRYAPGDRAEAVYVVDCLEHPAPEESRQALERAGYRRTGSRLLPHSRIDRYELSGPD